ncbi:MAG: hypothetical protein HWN81_16170 [Candidatus Lokiarchaeota archaeon]|nr:hypothetical protein [Candidatus Lokiarchaeota archaeon]
MKPNIITKTLGLEHPSVKKVLEIAEEIMNKNKVLNVENLYNLAKKRLKIPKRGLLSIIHFLLNKKILIEGSKFSKETLFSNKLRYNIYQFIKTTGGSHFSLIRKNVIADHSDNLGSSGQLIWHLEMLLKFRYIKKVKVGNYSVFLPFEMDEELGTINFLLKDKINRKILNILIEQESIKESDVYKLINEKRENVYYRINNLIEHNLIIVKEEFDNFVYLNPNQKNKIIQISKRIDFNSKS